MYQDTESFTYWRKLAKLHTSFSEDARCLCEFSIGYLGRLVEWTYGFVYAITLRIHDFGNAHLRYFHAAG